MVPATLKKLQKELKPVLDASPFRVEIALQDGGHRWIARIFWPYAGNPPRAYDNPEKESIGYKEGMPTMEYMLCGADQPTTEDLEYSGLDFWDSMREGLAGYLSWLQGTHEMDEQIKAAIKEEESRTVTLRGVRRMITKVVKAHGSTGQVYLPAEEIGHEAIIIFLDD